MNPDHKIDSGGLPARDAATRNPSLSDEIDNFDPVLDRLEVLVEKVTGFADKISGAQPQEVSLASKGEPVSYCMTRAVSARRERLVRALNRLEDQAGRIARDL